MANLDHSQHCSWWNCQPWPSRSQYWMFVYFIIILSHSQQFPTSSSQNQVEVGKWATGHFMHWTLAQVMAWCLTTPSHYLNQCWLFISEALCHSPESNFTVQAKASILYNEFQKLYFQNYQHISQGPSSQDTCGSLLIKPSHRKPINHWKFNLGWFSLVIFWAGA